MDAQRGEVFAALYGPDGKTQLIPPISAAPDVVLKEWSSEIDRPLRRDVRWLGRLLGEVLIDLEGEPLFTLEERIRKLAILRRRGPREERGQAAVELQTASCHLPQKPPSSTSGTATGRNWRSLLDLVMGSTFPVVI